jgi:hypothetical protein
VPIAPLSSCTATGTIAARTRSANGAAAVAEGVPAADCKAPAGVGGASLPAVFASGTVANAGRYKPDSISAMPSLAVPRNKPVFRLPAGCPSVPIRSLLIEKRTRMRFHNQVSFVRVEAQRLAAA